MNVDVTLKPGRTQKMDLGAASEAIGDAVHAYTNVVRVYATQDCYLAFGSNPTALADGTNMFLPAGQAEYFRVDGSDKVAAIRDSADGFVFVTEMTR